MKKITIDIFNDTLRHDFMEHLEMTRPAFTKREYDMAVAGLFSWAVASIIYERMTAVVKCDGKNTLTIHCKTISDGCNITAHIFANGRPVRDMVIAC